LVAEKYLKTFFFLLEKLTAGAASLLANRCKLQCEIRVFPVKTNNKTVWLLKQNPGVCQPEFEAGILVKKVFCRSQ
jgi:hypothetical protein